MDKELMAEAAETNNRALASHWRMVIRLVPVMLIVIGGTVLVMNHTTRNEFIKLTKSLRDMGLGGAFLFIGGFSFLIIAFFPITFLQLAAGYVYGFWGGYAVIAISKVLGTCTIFVIARACCAELCATNARKYKLF